MSSADADFSLGRELGLQMLRTPAPATRILALICDLAQDDLGLSSAFRLLATHRLFLDFFASPATESVASLASLRSLVDESLSPALALRVWAFIEGYISTRPNLSSRHSCQSEPGTPVKSFEYASPFEDSSSEPATEFASEPVSSHRNEETFSPSSAPSPPSTNRSLTAVVKPLLLLTSLVAVVLAVFKVDALCEPLGLCESSEKTDPLPKNSSPKDSDSSPATPSSPAPGAQSAVSPGSKVDSTTQPVAPVRSPQPASPSEAPLRDEPLW